MTRTCKQPAFPLIAISAAFVLALLAVGAAQSQTMYRIVSPDGRVTFTDKPPDASETATATNASGRPLPTGNSALPFALRQIATKYPVTLYTSANCAPCDSGRTMLRSRGIPFAERTVSTPEDSASLLRLTGETSMPFLTIGGQQIKGFSDSEWTQFLDAAGYPATSQLPATYRPAPATPLVTVQQPVVAPVTGREGGSTPQGGAPAPSNPAGITF
jgi:glutaredoxin